MSTTVRRNSPTPAPLIAARTGCACTLRRPSFQLGRDPGRQVPSRAAPEETTTDKKDEKEEAKEPPLSVTKHTITFHGQAMRYRATAGASPLKEARMEKPIEGPGWPAGGTAYPEGSPYRSPMLKSRWY